MKSKQQIQMIHIIMILKMVSIKTTRLICYFSLQQLFLQIISKDKSIKFTERLGTLIVLHNSIFDYYLSV